jgi:hypothetical protein
MMREDQLALFNPAAGRNCFNKAQWLIKRDNLLSYGYEFDQSAWIEPSK